MFEKPPCWAAPGTERWPVFRSSCERRTRPARIHKASCSRRVPLHASCERTWSRPERSFSKQGQCGKRSRRTRSKNPPEPLASEAFASRNPYVSHYPPRQVSPPERASLSPTPVGTHRAPGSFGKPKGCSPPFPSTSREETRSRRTRKLQKAIGEPLPPRAAAPQDGAPRFADTRAHCCYAPALGGSPHHGAN